MPIEEVRTLIQGLIDNSGLPDKLYDKNSTIIHINPTGRYVNHSSLHDSGLTGRKLIVDSFGGFLSGGGEILEMVYICRPSTTKMRATIKIQQ